MKKQKLSTWLLIILLAIALIIIILESFNGTLNFWQDLSSIIGIILVIIGIFLLITFRNKKRKKK